MTLEELYAANPEAKLLIEEAIKSTTEPLIRKQAELLNETNQAKQTAKSLQDALAELGDINELKRVKTLFSQNEELKLFAEGKHDEVFSRRTEKQNAEFEKKLKSALEDRDAMAKKASAFESRVLDNAIMQATLQIPTFDQKFIEDVLLHGRNKFTLDESGNAVAIANGNIVLGKDGKSPFTPMEWLSDIDATARWHKTANSGSGATGSAGTRQYKSTVTRAQYDAMLPTQQREAIMSGMTVVD